MAVNPTDLGEAADYLGISRGLITDDDLQLYGGGSISVSESDYDSAYTESVDMDNSLQRQQKYKNKADKYARQLEKDYEKKLSDWKSKYRTLKDKYDFLEEQTENERRAIRSRVREQENRNQVKFEELEAIARKYQDEVPLIRERHHELKEALGDFQLSPASYDVLKSKPEDRWTVREYILVRVYEMVGFYRDNLEKAKKARDEYSKQLLELQENYDKMERDYDHLYASSKSKTEDYSRQSSDLESRNRELQTEIGQLRAECEINKDKGRRYDILKQQMSSLEENHKSLLAQSEQNLQNNKSINDEKTRLMDELATLKTEVELLRANKVDLTKDNLALQDKSERLEDKLTEMQKDLLETKRVSQGYLDKLFATKESSHEMYEERITKELNDLKERHTKELERAKETLTEIHDKRLEFYKEAKEDSERKLDKANDKLREKEHGYDELMLEHRSLQRKYDAEFADLRTQCRFKTEELARVSSLYEETLTELKQMKIENEASRDKIDAVKSEYYKIESSCRQENADVKAQLAVAREKLLNYESIEQDLDRAIMDATNSTDLTENGMIFGAIHNAPTTSKRRIQQCLSLAQRLQSKQREAEDLQAELKAEREKYDDLQNQANLNRKLLEQTNQPYSYMVASMEEKEKEIASLKKRVKNLEKECLVRSEELKAMRESKATLEKDLNELISKRSTIDTLQNSLIDLMRSRGSDGMSAAGPGTAAGASKTIPRNEFNRAQRKEVSPPTRDNGSGNVPHWFRVLKNKNHQKNGFS